MAYEAGAGVGARAEGVQSGKGGFFSALFWSSPLCSDRGMFWLRSWRRGCSLRGAVEGVRGTAGGSAAGRRPCVLLPPGSYRTGESFRTCTRTPQKRAAKGETETLLFRFLEASTNQELNQQIPLFNLPSKILCRVVDVRLKVSSFSFALTHPNPRTGCQGSPQLRMEIQAHLQRQTSDLSLGENGELRVGVRCLARQRSAIPASVISSQSMHLGVLAAASHAVTTNTLFTVYYKPRVIISYYLRVEKFHVIDLFCFLLAEPTAALWYSGTNKPHEMLSFTGTDAENLETHDAWPCIQKERKGIDIVIAPSSHDQVLFDGWFREVQTPPRSSPSVPTSLNLFQEKNEETKCAAYTNCIEKDPSLKLDNGEGELRKPEGGRIAYRLFGIDLFNHTNCTADTGMVTGLPYGNSDQKPGFSKSSKEQKQSPEDNSKEIYGRHNCSGRSRTKVSE
ncbi:hypothetical protein B296_00017597 [Ensete ventricosum]|uniref:Uncharacterized protein n=1 Tax=Ensete ventricosum TaxID=4639 RepID=A0A427A0T1_ENSVE|nr:hypothetical protein B296_00017597 [Ensete ventricosum]